MRRLLKPLVFLVLLLPLTWLIYAALTENLGANPVENLLHELGGWSLRMMLLTLLMTPLRRLSGWSWPIKIRRMLGLFAFFYVCLHLFVYTGLDLGFDWPYLTEDILERPYITIGFLAWLLLIPLAVTSNRKMIRKLGKRWKSLHRLVYLIMTLGLIHFVWLIKKDLREPLIYCAIFLVLMALRAPLQWFSRTKKTSVGGHSYRSE